MIKKVPIFQNIKKEVCHDIMYSLTHKFMMPGEIMFHKNQPIDHITFLMRGSIELYTEMEGNEFVMERLNSGGVIHWESFILEDTNYLDTRCTETCLIYQLSHQAFWKILESNPNLKKLVQIHENTLLK